MLRPLKVHGTIECSQPASKSSWDSQDFGDISMVLKMAHFRKSTGSRWVKVILNLENILEATISLPITTYQNGYWHDIDMVDCKSKICVLDDSEQHLIGMKRFLIAETVPKWGEVELLWMFNITLGCVIHKMELWEHLKLKTDSYLIGDSFFCSQNAIFLR